MHTMCFGLIGCFPSDDNVHTMCFRLIGRVLHLMVMVMVRIPLLWRCKRLNKMPTSMMMVT